ncbi:MAG TPA: flavin reductase family protein [Candidatus Limiplasma sp.]|nr:flavin reductase family protein [Candidatus Limiplasma sp.]HRX07868.1 flavin reductase family protein [Candidatus Limiplasma sp.]
MNISTELTSILTSFAESGWDVIDGPAKAYLNGTGSKDALVAAVQQADAACGTCGCAYDPLYKRALQLLSGKPAKVSGALSNDFCPQTLFLYGTKKEDGSPNFGLFCWFSYCWDGGLSVMAAIGNSKLTKDRIKATGVFSANLVTEPMIPLADALGHTHGYDTHKMEIPIAVMQGAVLNVPVLSDSPVSFELEVTNTIPLDGSDVFICKVRNVLLHEALADKEASIEQRLQLALPAFSTCATYFSRSGKAMGAWGEAMKTLAKP